MSNLTRYTLVTQDDNGDECEGYVEQSDDGEFVKFDDIKELLNTAHNTASKKLLSDFVRYHKKYIREFNLAELVEQAEQLLA
jgi:hypothetical protein